MNLKPSIYPLLRLCLVLGVACMVGCRARQNQVIILSSWDAPGSGAYEFWLNGEPAAFLAPPFRHLQAGPPAVAGVNSLELRPLRDRKWDAGTIEMFVGNEAHGAFPAVTVDTAMAVKLDSGTSATVSSLPFPADYSTSAITQEALLFVSAYEKADIAKLSEFARLSLDDTQDSFPPWFWSGIDKVVSKPSSENELKVVRGKYYALVYKIPGQDMDSRGLITVRSGDEAVTQKFLLFTLDAGGKLQIARGLTASDYGTKR